MKYGYTSYNQALLRYCSLRVANKEVAEDIVQEVYTRTWLYLKHGNAIHNEKSFLFTTAHHLIIDEYRKRKTISLDTIFGTSDEPCTSTKEEQYTHDEVSRLLLIVELLPSNYHTVIKMRYVEDLSINEIAIVLGKTTTAISVRIHRGIKMLQKMCIQNMVIGGAYDKDSGWIPRGPVTASAHYRFDPKNVIPHLVVPDGIDTNGTIYYNDPAAKIGQKKISLDDFQKSWKMKYIVIRPGKEKRV
jgi:RNA polymerase sigma-70 factor (ECF subfamily)